MPDRQKPIATPTLQFMLALSLIGMTLATGCSKPTASELAEGGSPVITTQPVSLTVAAGQTATFTVVASGASPLTYQWYSNGAAISGANTTGYTTPALTEQNNGAKYDVVVANAVGSVTSNTAVLTVTGSGGCSAVPGIPGSVAAAATSSSQIGVNWTASSAAPSCAVSYNLYRSATSGFTPAASNQIASAQTGTSFADSGLSAATTYYYVVEAVDGFGSSSASAQASAETLGGSSSSSCTAVPAAPAGLTMSAASESTISLSWTADTAPANCSITYNVYGSTTSGFTPSSPNLIASGLTATSFTNTGLAASSTHFYVLEAVDANGPSAASAQLQASTTAAASTSTEIVAINSGGPTVSNATGGDASFVADEFYNAGGSSNSTGAVATAGIANAAPEAVYQSERNGQFTYTIPGLAPNASYTVLLHFAETYFTTAGARVFNVAINGGPVLSNFDIYAQAGGNTALVEPFTATADQQGQILIAYTNGTANQPKSSGIEIRGSASGCTVLPSAAPTGVTALASSPSIINLNWATVTPPPNCPITYNLYGSTNSGFTPSATTLIASGLTNTSYSNIGLAASTTYYYVVEAVDGAGASAPSTQTSAETNSATSCISVPSVMVIGLTATGASSNAIGLSWQPITPPDNCTNITYNIYSGTSSGFIPSPSNEIALRLPNAAFFNTSLPSSSTYYYVVQAVDEDGASSEVSGPASATTLAPAAKLTATATSANEIDLTFPASTAVAPVTYQIFRSTTQSFTPSGSNHVGSTKSNFYQDMVVAAATTYYYIVQASGPAGTTTVGGPVSATTLALGNSAPFWDATNMPATPSGDVMTFKFLNRTNGQYPDDQVYWSVTLNGVTTTNTIAAQPYFQMPANASGRMYFYLGGVGQAGTNYFDFIEYTIGPTSFNGDTTRVDAFGIKLAFQLSCGDGTDIAVGENAAMFAENRATTFQRYIDAVPTDFQTLAELDAPYEILSPGAGGFDTGGPYDDYYNAYIAEVWASNGLTIPIAGDNGDGLGAYPDLSAAIYRHVAAPGTFNPNGSLISQSLWGNPNNFYQTAPASYYGQFFHANAINGQQYTFPYDDAGGYSSDVGCANPHTLLVAVGW